MTTSRQHIIELVKTYTNDLFAYTLLKVQQREIAEDLVQETFLSAYQSYGTFEGRSNIKTWLFSILKRKIADHYRSKYRSAAEVSSGILQEYFDENHRWKDEFRPQAWSNENQLLDDPEFAEA